MFTLEEFKPFYKSNISHVCDIDQRSYYKCFPQHTAVSSIAHESRVSFGEMKCFIYVIVYLLNMGSSPSTRLACERCVLVNNLSRVYAILGIAHMFAESGFVSAISNLSLLNCSSSLMKTRKKMFSVKTLMTELLNAVLESAHAGFIERTEKLLSERALR